LGGFFLFPLSFFFAFIFGVFFCVLSFQQFFF
jgi:hypothetical protein